MEHRNKGRREEERKENSRNKEQENKSGLAWAGCSYTEANLLAIPSEGLPIFQLKIMKKEVGITQRTSPFQYFEIQIHTYFVFCI